MTQIVKLWHPYNQSQPFINVQNLLHFYNVYFYNVSILKVQTFTSYYKTVTFSSVLQNVFK